MLRINLRPLFVPAVIVACVVLMMSLAYTAPSEAAMEVMLYAAEKGIDFSEYPDSLIRLLERNPETKEFVLNYPFRTENPVDLDDYDIARRVPLFLQWDTQWGYLTYGDDFVAVTGSGPMCLAMAGSYVTGGDDRFSPEQVVAFAQEKGFAAKGNGSARTLISQGGAALGLEVKELPREEKKIADYLNNGDPIIALMQEKTAFSESGHFIVITSYEDGLLSINDPESLANSQQEWPFDELVQQIRSLWVIRM